MVQQTTRIKKEYVDSYIAEEPVTYRPEVTHDMEQEQELVQHAEQ